MDRSVERDLRCLLPLISRHYGNIVVQPHIRLSTKQESILARYRGRLLLEAVLLEECDRRCLEQDPENGVLLGYIHKILPALGFCLIELSKSAGHPQADADGEKEKKQHLLGCCGGTNRPMTIQ